MSHILEKLLKDIDLALELPPSEPIQYETNLLKDALYLFYLDASQLSDPVKLQTSSDFLLQNFASFILYQKQESASDQLSSKLISQNLSLLKIYLSKFISNLINSEPKSVTVLSLDQVISYISQCDSSKTLNSYLSSEILKEKSYLESIIIDIESGSISCPDNYSHLYSKAKLIIQKFIDDWTVLSNSNDLSPSNIETCKKVSADVDYLTASVIFNQLIALDPEEIEEEVEEIEEILLRLSKV